MHDSKLGRFTYSAIRLVLGFIITGAGIGKISDLPGFVGVIHTYKLGLATWFLWPVAIVVTVLELTIGLAILVGRCLRTGALFAIIMHAGYAVLLTATLLRGIHLQDCGCFGVFLARPLTWHSPIEDLILMGFSYLLFVLAPVKR
jgi:uncharacterized membrane protein YphA (DoxX/SURF4 family)